jgi:hypothetical protein
MGVLLGRVGGQGEGFAPAEFEALAVAKGIGDTNAVLRRFAGQFA